MKTYMVKRRRVNIKNCYIILVTLVALASLLGNYVQNKFYNKALDIQQVTIDRYASNDYSTMDFAGE